MGNEMVTGYLFKKVELWEISQAAVPGNPRALKKIFTPKATAPAAPVPMSESGKGEKDTLAKAFKNALAEINQEVNK